jgi:hypothetical protein
MRSQAKGVVAVLEAMEPDAPLLQGQEEAFDHAVLLRRIHSVNRVTDRKTAPA